MYVNGNRYSKTLITRTPLQLDRSGHNVKVMSLLSLTKETWLVFVTLS